MQVVCIDQSDSSPSCTPERRTNAITVSVRSTSSMRSVVSTSMVSATTARPPALAEVVFATGVSRTVTTELLDITPFMVTFRGSTDAYPDRKGSWVQSPHGPATVSEDAFDAREARVHGHCRMTGRSGRRDDPRVRRPPVQGQVHFEARETPGRQP